MSKELATLDRSAVPTPSLPLRLSKLIGSMGTVEWIGQPVRYDLPDGIGLTAEDRKEAKTLLRVMERVVAPDCLLMVGPEEKPEMARLRHLTALLLAYSTSREGSSLGAVARQDLYLDAIHDLPAWTIEAAKRKWARGESGIKDARYEFAPAPAFLRDMARRELEPYQYSIAMLRRLLAAVPTSEAMNPERTAVAVVPAFKAI